MNQTEPREQPTPAVKTEIVSEVSFTKDQLVELIRTHYGAEIIPRVEIEADAIYGCGKLSHVSLKWSKPR